MTKVLQEREAAAVLAGIFQLLELGQHVAAKFTAGKIRDAASFDEAYVQLEGWAHAVAELRAAGGDKLRAALQLIVHGAALPEAKEKIVHGWLAKRELQALAQLVGYVETHSDGSLDSTLKLAHRGLAHFTERSE